jgi:hypothetical protein
MVERFNGDVDVEIIDDENNRKTTDSMKIQFLTWMDGLRRVLRLHAGLCLGLMCSPR